MKHISSIQNNLIREVVALQSKAKTRKEKGLFIVEGQRELQLALHGGFEAKTIFWCAEIFRTGEFEKWQSKFDEKTEYVRVSHEVYQKIGMRENTEGVVGVLLQKNKDVTDWAPKNKNPLIIVLESIEKPGNLGAVLRTADAVKVDAVLVTKQHTDLYNPNVIRSSVGGFFNVPIFICDNQQAYDFLNNRAIKMYAASLQKSTFYTLKDYTKPTAFIMGSEANGLSTFWYQKGVSSVKIPMLGQVDSLNVSVATAILAYEAIRQRKS